MDLLLALGGDQLSPLMAIGLGLIAGVGGTVGMTVYQELVGKLKSALSSGGGSGGGSAEAADRQEQWSQQSAPAQVGQRVIEGVLHKHVPLQRANLLTHAVHWSYGIAWGAAYGLVQGTIEAWWVAAGLVFGVVVWLAAYVFLPALRIYQPPWKYPPATLAVDLSYHLVYGISVAVVFQVLRQL